MLQKEKISEILVIAGIAAFAYYRYSKLTQEEKDNIHNEVKEIGGKIMKELVPAQIKTFLPEQFK